MPPRVEAAKAMSPNLTTNSAIGVEMLTLREALQNADNNKIALSHFNVSELSGFHAVVRAGRRLNLSFMIGVSEGEREFIGLKEIALLVRIAREEYGVSLYLNADHTHSLEKSRAAAEAGFDEVIFDSSHLPLEENIRETRHAVEVLKSIRPDLIVEGEIGFIGPSSEIVENVPVESLKLTTPEEAAQFVAETKVDALAPAVGNMHGLLPSMVRGEAHKRLDIERIRQIKQATGAFLTLHGGSGTEDADFVAGIHAGLNIIHINTELRVAWRQGLESSLRTHAHEVAPYKILPGAELAMEDVATRRLTLFDSSRSS
jgi:fructose-bisphosphate aldolase class II